MGAEASINDAYQEGAVLNPVVNFAPALPPNQRAGNLLCDEEKKCRMFLNGKIWIGKESPW